MFSPSATQAGRPARWPALLLLAGLCLVLSGCGWLYNYEGQMATEQARVERFDQENDYLDAPLDTSEMPKVKDPSDKSGKTELGVPLVFFRPPLGIGPKPEKGGGPEPFLHYVRDPKRVTKETRDRAVYTDVYLWVVPADGISTKSFQDKAFSPFRKELEGVQPERLDEHPLGRPTLTYSPAYRKSPSGLSLYLCQRNGADVAIAFKLPENVAAPRLNRTGPEGTPVQMTVTDLSLESLAVEKEAKPLVKEYDLRRRHK